MKTLMTILATASSVLAAGSIALAQEAPPAAAPPAAPYSDPACGSWSGDVWTPNGSCPTTAYKHEVVSGTIVSVKGHLVTVQQTARQVVIDDTAALNDQTSGRVAVGRRIVAHGYWQAGNFYATAITGGQLPPPGR